MPREKPDWRDNIYLLNARFPDHDMLTIEECMEVFGWKSINTVKKHLGHLIVCNRISKAALARFMCA